MTYYVVISKDNYTIFNSIENAKILAKKDNNSTIKLFKSRIEASSYINNMTITNKLIDVSIFSLKGKVYITGDGIGYKHSVDDSDTITTIDYVNALTEFLEMNIVSKTFKLLIYSDNEQLVKLHCKYRKNSSIKIDSKMKTLFDELSQYKTKMYKRSNNNL